MAHDGRTILTVLRARNGREVDVLRGVVGAYASLCDDAGRRRRDLSALDRLAKQLREEKDSLKDELLTKDGNEHKAAMADELSSKNSALGEEIMQSYKENARIAQVSEARATSVT